SDQGVLFPRMTSSERDAIANPAQGLTIYNRTENCLQWWNNSGWYDACTGNTFVASVSGSSFTNGFENNTTCSSKLISVTPCSAVAGASINDDASTTEGIEYDWTEASNTTLGEGFGAPSNTRALVEIGGQCWAKFNMNIETNSGSFCYQNNANICATDGRLYQWDAAMDNTTAERDQGACPDGWHVPSDCEWMYLENTLGMDVAEQDIIGQRNTGDVGSQLSSDTSNGDNSSGFSALLAGRRRATGAFFERNLLAQFWTSTNTSANLAIYRRLRTSQTGVRRVNLNKDNAISLRCLKD
ncbi:MAG: FISUMP domain-containing protein, partial [Psychroflexus sp.]|nr:FISUMP domain-containing protein [Psychroflexus sp.]